MAYRFTASRVSGDGNIVFPDQIIIDDDENRVIYQKGTLLGYKSTTLRFAAIGCVSRMNIYLLLKYLAYEQITSKTKIFDYTGRFFSLVFAS